MFIEKKSQFQGMFPDLAVSMIRVKGEITGETRRQTRAKAEFFACQTDVRVEISSRTFHGQLSQKDEERCSSHVVAFKFSIEANPRTRIHRFCYVASFFMEFRFKR